MPMFHKIYTFFWIIALTAAFIILFLDRKKFSILQKQYILFLSKPWKLVTFLFSTVFMTFIAPLSGDYTWDYLDGFIMSVLTCLTAPWVVWIFYRFRNRSTSFKQIFVAFCFWMFSVSWFYDFYIYFRDHVYPPAWLPNLILSSILYWCAGLWWNLDWSPQRGVHFSFTKKGDEWFVLSNHSVFWKIMRKGWLYVVIVAVLCGAVIYKLNTSS